MFTTNVNGYAGLTTGYWAILGIGASVQTAKTYVYVGLFPSEATANTLTNPLTVITIELETPIEGAPLWGQAITLLEPMISGLHQFTMQQPVAGPPSGVEGT